MMMKLTQGVRQRLLAWRTKLGEIEQFHNRWVDTHF